MISKIRVCCSYLMQIQATTPHNGKALNKYESYEFKVSWDQDTPNVYGKSMFCNAVCWNDSTSSDSCASIFTIYLSQQSTTSYHSYYLLDHVRLNKCQKVAGNIHQELVSRIFCTSCAAEAITEKMMNILQVN